MPNINLTSSSDGDLGNRYITKEYLMSVYPQIANQLITPELWTWGRNGYATLGNFASVPYTPVTTLAGGANWKQSSSSRHHMAAIKTDGTLWTWGYNTFSELGDITSSTRSTPVTTFAGGTNWRQVACGYRFTTAIKTDGTLWVWGNNAYAKLGTNNGFNSGSPITTFAGGTNWKQVSTGNNFTAAIKTDGTLWTWGEGFLGKLGDNTTITKSTPVTTFAGGTNWKQVSCGNHFTAAIKTDGTLWAWGQGSSGQLGDNTATNKATPVTTFAGGTNWKQVAGGFNFTVAIKTDGTLWGWGGGTSGQLGDNTAVTRSNPVTTFAGGTNWKQVSCGYQHTAAIKTDGTLWGWGYNGFGELGNNGVGAQSLTPITTFAGGTNWKQVGITNSTRYYSAAIKTSDDLQGI